MTKLPRVSPGDWINVGKRECVIANVFEPGGQFGDCEVVFNPQKPTNTSVRWTGNGWEFASDDYGGYADKYPRLEHYVAILKRGRFP